MWKGKDILIRKAVEEEDNEYRITDETSNIAMAFQPSAISLQYNPHTEISPAIYRTEIRKTLMLFKSISSNPSYL